MTPHLFLNNIAHILNDKTIIIKMSADAEKFATPQAARKIAEEVFYFGEL